MNGLWINLMECVSNTIMATVGMLLIYVSILWVVYKIRQRREIKCWQKVARQLIELKRQREEDKP